MITPLALVRRPFLLLLLDALSEEMPPGEDSALFHRERFKFYRKGFEGCSTWNKFEAALFLLENP
jgi:hypothetical protein